MEAKQTPLIDLLERVPQDAKLVVEHDQFSSSSHPVGRLCHEAAAVLRAALAEPVQKADYWQEEARRYAGNADYWRKRYEALTEPCGDPAEYDAQPQEPVQEPVAWRTFDGEGGYEYRTYEDNENYAAEWTQRNPRYAGWVEPLYTTPPQRKPLTDEEIDRITRVRWGGQLLGVMVLAHREYARAIEQAHNIKE